MVVADPSPATLPFSSTLSYLVTEMLEFPSLDMSMIESVGATMAPLDSDKAATIETNSLRQQP